MFNGPELEVTHHDSEEPFEGAEETLTLTVKQQFNRDGWLLNEPGALVYPISLPVGCRVTSWAVRVEKASGAFFHGELVTVIDGEQHAVGPLVTLGGVPAGVYTLEGEVNHTLAPRRDHHIRITRGGSPTVVTDRAFWAETRHECPVPGAF